MEGTLPLWIADLGEEPQMNADERRGGQIGNFGFPIWEGENHKGH